KKVFVLCRVARERLNVPARCHRVQHRHSERGCRVERCCLFEHVTHEHALHVELVQPSKCLADALRRINVCVDDDGFEVSTTHSTARVDLINCEHRPAQRERPVTC